MVNKNVGLNGKTILVTGSPGFIGANLVNHLLRDLIGCMQPGDVAVTYADSSGLEKNYDFRPTTPIRDGLRAFEEWYAAIGMTFLPMK